MIYNSTQNSPCYFPPILGNGDITLAPDCQGALNYNSTDFKNMRTFDGLVFRAGRRLAVGHDDLHAQLVSFGKFTFNCESSVKTFSQELDCQNGFIKSICNYENENKIHSSCFIHPTHNLYALKKTLHGTDSTFSYTYSLCGYDQSTNDCIAKSEYAESVNGCKISFKMFGQDIYIGEIVFCLDKKCNVRIGNNSVTLSASVKDGEDICMYFYMEDDLFDSEFQKTNLNLENKIKVCGFDGLLEENKSSWNEYFQEGFVKTDDEKLNEVYVSALYNLKCYTTRWSIPVGLNNATWHGRFFAFDEYYSFLGLLGANRLGLAKRVPDFRLNVCLEKAIFRATAKDTGEQARFMWETNEYGEETSPCGHWYEHVFHMALIAIGAFEYYEHSCDVNYLKKCYPMIRACAKFFTLHMLYEDGNKLYLGKCTDLERLGPSVENPFMSACGVIKTLEILVEAAKILNVDEDYKTECEIKAKRLRDSLPFENGMYVPYLGCEQKSVGVFACKFPYDVLKDDDAKMLNAWKDFEKNGGLYGNMYDVGNGISPWYACWQAEAFARCCNADKAQKWLNRSLESNGVFGEMFEINEPKKILRPWFTTASGIFLSTLNELLLQSDGKNIYILPAYADSGKSMSFKLSAKGGLIVEAEISNGKLINIDITPREKHISNEFNIYFKGKFIKKITV